MGVILNGGRRGDRSEESREYSFGECCHHPPDSLLRSE